MWRAPGGAGRAAPQPGATIGVQVANGAPPWPPRRQGAALPPAQGCVGANPGPWGCPGAHPALKLPHQPLGGRPQAIRQHSGKREGNPRAVRRTTRPSCAHRPQRTAGGAGRDGSAPRMSAAGSMAQSECRVEPLRPDRRTPHPPTPDRHCKEPRGRPPARPS